MNCLNCGAPNVPGAFACVACRFALPTAVAPQGPPGYPPYGMPAYGGPPTGYPYPNPMTGSLPSTNGLAIAALVCGILGFFTCGLGSILGIIFGLIARGQISRSGGREGGAGLALAGLVLGGAVLAIGVIIILAVSLIGTNANEKFRSVGTSLQAARAVAPFLRIR